MTIEKFKGLYTALITPFKHGTIDIEAWVKLIEWQIEAGVNGLLVAGSTGEGYSLNADEYHQLISSAMQTVQNRVPVIVGAGANTTREAIRLSSVAEDLKADAVLIVTPYYNKPTQEGLYQHYKAIAQAVKIPIMLYNNPGRSIIDMSDSVIVKLAEFDNIIGIKDATGKLDRPLNLLGKIKRDFAQLTGDDITGLAFNAHGGVGCFSIASNAAPHLCVEVQKLWATGKHAEALQLQLKLVPLYETMGIESNPIPAKYAASLLGICTEEIRLPLVSPSPANQQIIRSTLESLV